MKSTTNPNLYIIESLELDDEDENRFEGRLLADMLEIIGKRPIYKYIRTSTEFEHYFEDFCNSDYRYLHISCHGSKTALATTFSEVMFEDLADMMKDKLKKKRLFISACEAVNDEFANLIMPASGCNSIIGPTTKLYTNDALVFWASFYHLIFKANPSAVNMEIIKSTLKGLLKVHTGFDFKYYFNAKGKVKQVTLK
jgi:hypothetical protein